MLLQALENLAPQFEACVPLQKERHFILINFQRLSYHLVVVELLILKEGIQLLLVLGQLLGTLFNPFLDRGQIVFHVKGELYLTSLR